MATSGNNGQAQYVSFSARVAILDTNPSIDPELADSRCRPSLKISAN
jgi:hypothetical protein